MAIRNRKKQWVYPRGVTLVETVFAMLILSGAFVAVLNSVSVARGTQLITSERAVGQSLAEDLLAEILQQDYAEPGSTSLGSDGSESFGPGRSQYDDIDDYAGWSASPPMTKAGVAIAGMDDYTRVVSVQWVNPLALSSVTNSDQGIKRIEVTILRRDRQVAQLVAYRTATFRPAGDE